MSDDHVKIAKEFERKFENYRGWVFEYMYPGVFSYSHHKSKNDVYFTPDHNEKGMIAGSVMPKDGSEQVSSGDVPFPRRNAVALFAAVKPWLDQYHPTQR